MSTVELKANVADLKVASRSHSRAIHKLSVEQHRMGLLMDEMRSDIKLMVDVLLPRKRREEQFDTMEDKVEQHEDRLVAVEDTVKDHIQNHQ